MRVRAAARPLDETRWQTWVTKGYVRDRRSSAAWMNAVKWVSMAGLVGAAAVWSHPTPLDIVLRFVVALGAIVMMVHAFHARQYAFAAVFGALVVLYNPVAQVFSFSGDWPRAIVVASAVPFLASINWRDVRLAHNV